MLILTAMMRLMMVTAVHTTAAALLTTMIVMKTGTMNTETVNLVTNAAHNDGCNLLLL